MYNMYVQLKIWVYA